MNTSQTGSLSEILAGGKINKAILAYFRERLQNRLHQFILREFISKQKEGLTQADIARMLGRRPEQIHRWLGSPSNLTTDTVSDLLLAISKAEVELFSNKIAEQPARNYRFPEWIDPKYLPKPKMKDVRASNKAPIVDAAALEPLCQDVEAKRGSVLLYSGRDSATIDISSEHRPEELRPSPTAMQQRTTIFKRRPVRDRFVVKPGDEMMFEIEPTRQVETGRARFLGETPLTAVVS